MNSRSGSLIVSMTIVLASAPGAVAATVRVPQQYSTIGAALAAAHNGDHIIVADGVYTGSGNRNLDVAGKHIRLESASGPANCIIDCQAQGRAFYFHSGEPPGAMLEGFTIRNALATGDGGAILCDSASPTLRNCVFRQNRVAGVYHQGGGALAVFGDSFVRVYDCQFIESAEITADEFNGGGALHVTNGARASFTRCTFASNRASAAGAAAITLGARATFQECRFEDNLAQPFFGGAIGILDAGAEFKGCRFVGNTSSGAGGAMGIILQGNVVAKGCRFERNTAGAIGGAIVLGDAATVVVDDSIMSGNSGNGDGGAVASMDSTVTVTNSTIVGNAVRLTNDPQPHAWGGGICAWGSSINVSNCVMHGNTTDGEGPAFALILQDLKNSVPMELTVSSSLVEHGRPALFLQDPSDPNLVLNWSATNFDASPFFMDALGPDGIPWTGDEDLHLRPGSPCIDAGDPNYVARPGETDLDGNPRVVDGNGDGIAVIDIGAYEYQPAGRRSPGPPP